MTRREKMVVAAGAALLAVAWAGTRALPAMHRALESRSARIEHDRRALAAAEHLISIEPQLRVALAARARELVRNADRLFTGASIADASADLGSYVLGLAAVNTVRVERQDASVDSSGVFPALQLRLEVETDITGLAGWLDELRRGRKLVTVRELSVSALEPAAPVATAERLRVEVVFSALGTISRAPERGE